MLPRKVNRIDGYTQCQSSVVKLCCNEKHGKFVGKTVEASGLFGHIGNYSGLKRIRGSCQQNSVLDKTGTAFMFQHSLF